MNLDGFALPVKKLKGTDPVETLDLSRKRLWVPSAIVIASLIGVNGSLTEGNLRENKLGVEGWAIIFNALRDSPTSKITKWDLTDELLGPEIAKPLAEYISVTGSLTELNLVRNEIGSEGAAAIAKGLSDNGSLTKGR